MSEYAESVYSPQTGTQQLVIARREHENQVAVFAQRMQEQMLVIDNQKRAVERQRAKVQEQEAENWRVTNDLRTQQAMVENKVALVRRDEEAVARRDRELQVLEDQRRRNRTISLAFIEDSFAHLSPRTVVENLTNSSSRIRNHAMANISACIGGKRNSSPTFVRLTPQDIAPYLLPKLHQLLSSSTKPIDSVVQFAEESVSDSPMAKALALGGQCSLLSGYLIESNELVSHFAVCGFRRMVGMETSVVKPAYEALALAIPEISIIESNVQPLHPSIELIKEVSPKIIEDCFNNGLWLAVKPLVCHHITSIRQIVLRKVVMLAQQSDRNRNGIVEAHILGLLDSYYPSSSSPPDVVNFFVELLPVVAEKLCRTPAAVQWLLKRLSDPSARINATVIDAFRTCMTHDDPAVLALFVKAELLRKLDESPTLQPFAVTKLICSMLSALAIPYARAKSAAGIVRFLDHSDLGVADASLSACVKIVESTLEDRTHLFTVVSNLNSSKESTLRLYDHAMPVFCTDWAKSGDYKMIVQYIRHPEERIRLPAQRVWFDIVSNSSTARSKIVHDDLLDVIFELCNSQYNDAVMLGARCCAPMAVEITKAGVTFTRQLVALLSHPNVLLRQASLRGIQISSESTDKACKVLLEAETFQALQIFFEAYPKDLVENAHKILVRLAPFLHTSHEACAGLLQLLNSNSAMVQHAARDALSTISNTNIGNRETLRSVVLGHLELPTEPFIEYAVKAIQDWIGPDLAQLNDFPKFFSLVEHSDRRIQNAALISLKQKLSGVAYQESLEKADIIYLLRSLANSDSPEALNFVVAALRALALILARNGHASIMIDLLVHKEPKVRDGAGAALETIASGSGRDRKLLLEEDFIQRLAGHEEHLEQTQTHLLASIVPMLAFDYLEAGKTDIIFALVDHPQQQIRTAASKSLVAIASGTAEQRACLRGALLPLLGQASPLLREVAATCLSQSLASDLMVDGEFTQILRIVHNEDIRVREPIIAQLRAYIQDSDPPAHRRLVDAKVLPEILQAYTPGKDDLLDFMSNCLLPMLGPTFTQDNGGATLFPLLSHDEHQLRVSAIQALQNAIDSRYGSMENMAKAYVVGTLHPLITSDDVIRDLWCRILPKVAPYVTDRAEINIVFESLNDDRGNMRVAASEAVAIMAKTSETTRSRMLPTLLHVLQNPSPDSIPSIAQAIFYSGITFISNGKEAELLHLIKNGKNGNDVSIAAVEATTSLLAKGGSFEHQQLVKATPDILTVALELHAVPSQRQHSLKLLLGIITHLSYMLLYDEEHARNMFELFSDPDIGLSNALYQTWANDSRVFESDTLPELLPLLFNEEKLRNPCVTALLRELAPIMVPQLMSRRRLDILVNALMINDANVVRSYLHETCSVIENSNEIEKGWFVNEPSFVSAVGHYLKGHDTTMRRDSSTIVQLLSKDSALRSGRIMNEGIGSHLSWVVLHGEKAAQQSSLQALFSLFMAAPDHAERLVIDSLPALCDILENEDLIVGVYTKAFRLLHEIVKQSPHSTIIESGIVLYLVRWLSPRYSVTDTECRKYDFHICQLIAQHSEPGRQALIDAGILVELLSLASSQAASDVIGACKILKALAHTGTFRQNIVTAGLKTSMEHITSVFRKSTLQNKEEKRLAQAAAKEVLDTLKVTKQSGVKSPLDTQLPQHSRIRSEPTLSAFRQESSMNGANRNRLRRTASESVAIPDFDTPTFDDQAEEERPSTIRRLSHSRSLSEPDRSVLRSQRIQLSAVQEDPDVADLSRREEELDYAEPSLVGGLRMGHRRQSSHPIRVVSSGALRDEDHLTDTSSFAALTTSRTAPPSYKPLASVSGSVRRPMNPDPDQELPPMIAGESVQNYTGAGPSRFSAFKAASRSANRKRSIE